MSLIDPRVPFPSGAGMMSSGDLPWYAMSGAPATLDYPTSGLLNAPAVFPTAPAAAQPPKMNLFDRLFGGGLSKLLPPEEQKAARQAAMLHAGLSLMAAGSRQPGYTSVGAGLLGGAQAGQEAYQNHVATLIQAQQIAEAQKQKQMRDAIFQQFAPPPNATKEQTNAALREVALRLLQIHDPSVGQILDYLKSQGEDKPVVVAPGASLVSPKGTPLYTAPKPLEHRDTGAHIEYFREEDPSKVLYRVPKEQVPGAGEGSWQAVDDPAHPGQLVFYNPKEKTTQVTGFTAKNDPLVAAERKLDAYTQVNRSEIESAVKTITENPKPTLSAIAWARSTDAAIQAGKPFQPLAQLLANTDPATRRYLSALREVAQAKLAMLPSGTRGGWQMIDSRISEYINGIAQGYEGSTLEGSLSDIGRSLERLGSRGAGGAGTKTAGRSDSEPDPTKNLKAWLAWKKQHPEQ